MSKFKIQPIDITLLNKVRHKAVHSPRLRMNHNFHEPEDTVQRFLNAIEPGSYVRPHRHINPKKDEIFLVLTGKGAIVTFDNLGGVSAVYPLNPQKGYWGVDIEGGVYHTIVSLAPGSVFYEIKSGPFDPEADKGFADWAPEEKTEAAKTYLNQLEAEIQTDG